MNSKDNVGACEPAREAQGSEGTATGIEWLERYGYSVFRMDEFTPRLWRVCYASLDDIVCVDAATLQAAIDAAEQQRAKDAAVRSTQADQQPPTGAEGGKS